MKTDVWGCYCSDALVGGLYRHIFLAQVKAARSTDEQHIDVQSQTPVVHIPEISIKIQIFYDSANKRVTI